ISWTVIMSLPLRKVSSILVGMAVAATMSCKDRGITNPGTSAEPEGLIVSSPMLLSPGHSERVAFVSLMPGTAPGGVRASIVNRANGVTQTVSLTDDGFDPVPITARAGDSIEVSVTNAVTVTVFHAVVAVRSVRRPVVVRTDPPTKTSGVSLDVTIQVVFSAPIDGTTLTAESVQLFRGPTPVAGTPELSWEDGNIAVFQPTGLLAANTPYRLVIAQSIRDMNQAALESPVDVEFTTAN